MDIERPKSKQPIPENAKIIFKGVIFDVYQWEQKMYDGSTKIFEKMKRPDTVIVFPVMDDGSIMLADQEQPGKEIGIAAIGGRMDEGEDPLKAIKRELLEESGYEAREWILWNAHHVTPKLDWVVYAFVAKGLKKVAEPHLDGGEKAVLTTFRFDEFLKLALDKKLNDKEVIADLLEAQVDPQKMAKLKELFKPL